MGPSPECAFMSPHYGNFIATSRQAQAPPAGYVSKDFQTILEEIPSEELSPYVAVTSAAPRREMGMPTSMEFTVPGYVNSESWTPPASYGRQSLWANVIHSGSTISSATTLSIYGQRATHGSNLSAVIPLEHSSAGTPIAAEEPMPPIVRQYLANPYQNSAFSNENAMTGVPFSELSSAGQTRLSDYPQTISSDAVPLPHLNYLATWIERDAEPVYPSCTDETLPTREEESLELSVHRGRPPYNGGVSQLRDMCNREIKAARRKGVEGAGKQAAAINGRKKDCKRERKPTVLKFRLENMSNIKDERSIARTKANRAHKACPFCKKRRQQCDRRWHRYIECLRLPLKDFKPSNFMYEITEVKLFRQRPGANHPVASDREELYLLQELDGTRPSRKQVRLSQGLRCELEIFVKLYDIQEGDKITRVVRWNDTNFQVPLLPYCLASIQETRKELEKYIRNSQQKYLHYVVEKSDPLTQCVLRCAIAFQDETKSSLLSAALQILALCRMIELSWVILGEETLGIEEALHRHIGGIGPLEVPITPMMSVQLDQIIIQNFLNPLAERLLKELRTQLYERKWSAFEIFLTQYILGTHYEWLLRHSRYNALKYSIPRRYNNMKQAKAFILGHNILITHFHYFTKHSPIQTESHARRCEDRQGMTTDQISFIQRVRAAMMARNVKELRKLKHYEQSLYFAHQIFDGLDWDPESEEVADLVLGC